VAIVILENTNYADVVGSAAMPYLNGLISRFGLATNYYANTHPSIGNYFMLTTGQIVTNDDNFLGTVSDDNIVRRLAQAGKTWKTYQESLPAAGYIGNDHYPYIKHHNPFAYFSDVVNSAAQRTNIVPLSQLSTDRNSGSLPSYAFIVPDNQHNGHDCPSRARSCSPAARLRPVNEWLKTHIAPLVEDTNFQKTGVLLILFDEADVADTANGGGRIPVVVVSGKVRPGLRSATFLQHQSALRLSLEALGVAAIPGAGANAPSMNDFFER
jgi:acid phosphatase